MSSVEARLKSISLDPVLPIPISIDLRWWESYFTLIEFWAGIGLEKLEKMELGRKVEELLFPTGDQLTVWESSADISSRGLGDRMMERIAPVLGLVVVGGGVYMALQSLFRAPVGMPDTSPKGLPAAPVGEIRGGDGQPPLQLKSIDEGELPAVLRLRWEAIKNESGGEVVFGWRALVDEGGDIPVGLILGVEGEDTSGVATTVAEAMVVDDGDPNRVWVNGEQMVEFPDLVVTEVQIPIAGGEFRTVEIGVPDDDALRAAVEVLRASGIEALEYRKRVAMEAGGRGEQMEIRLLDPDVVGSKALEAATFTQAVAVYLTQKGLKVTEVRSIGSAVKYVGSRESDTDVLVLVEGDKDIWGAVVKMGGDRKPEAVRWIKQFFGLNEAVGGDIIVMTEGDYLRAGSGEWVRSKIVVGVVDLHFRK